MGCFGLAVCVCSDSGGSFTWPGVKLDFQTDPHGSSQVLDSSNPWGWVSIEQLDDVHLRTDGHLLVFDLDMALGPEMRIVTSERFPDSHGIRHRACELYLHAALRGLAKTSRGGIRFGCRLCGRVTRPQVRRSFRPWWPGSAAHYYTPARENWCAARATHNAPERFLITAMRI